MQIPEHKIQEVLDRVDLVALISRYTELKKSGRSYKGRCPFHQEKTPSFYVWPDSERKGFKCFGCQAGGDAISFVQRYLGKTFVDAVKDLAREVNVDLSMAEDPGAREKGQLREATEFAARHFVDRLWSSPHGKLGRDYLASRGVSEEVARGFGLGWAVNAWSDLTDALAKAGMVEWAEKAGLVQRRQRGDGWYDFFRGRLIIPIRGPEGRTIAFGGRLVEGTEGPKYFNSRESRLYNKSETLYALDLARDEIRKRRSAVLVEGYFDVIGMHQAGVKNTVALCSTALTAGHLGVLARAEAKELVLLLDGDAAGRKAVETLAGPILAHGVAAKVALLPEGEDPDTFARKAGADGVRVLLDSARPLTEHLFLTLLPNGARSSFEDKMKAVDRLKPVTAALPVGLTRSAFFGALATWSGLPAIELEAALRGKEPPLRPAPKPAAPAAPQRRAVERPPDPLEAWYLAAAVRDPALLSLDQYRVCDELAHPGLRGALANLIAGRTGDEALLGDATEPVRRALGDAARQLPEDPGALSQGFRAVCTRLKLRRIDEQLSHIARVTGQVATANELTEETRRLLGERAELLALRKRVLAEAQPVTAGTKTPQEPV